MNNCTKENCPMQKGIKCDLEECPYKTSADVVEVVRCKDCKYFEKSSYIAESDKSVLGFCHCHAEPWWDTEFCSHGERRETE